MVRALANDLTKVELGSKLRKDVWNKEVEGYGMKATFRFFWLTPVQPQSAVFTEDHDRCLWSYRRRQIVLVKCSS
jgi:hypothetical protein